jgi:membrane-associated phospholipid phosphatase
LNLWWLIVAGAGLLIAGWSVSTARRPAIPAFEVRVFETINGLPDALFWPFWFPMQLGNLWVGGAAGLIVALTDRELGAALGVIGVMALKVVAERVVEHAIGGYAAIRQRPGTSEVGAVRRGDDVPISGPSFPSGHIVLAAGVASVIAPILPLAWIWVPVPIVVLVMLGRVYVGAHNPLDVTAGLGAGLLVGGIIGSLVN